MVAYLPAFLLLVVLFSRICLGAESAARKYEVPAGFEHLLNHQIVEVDLLLAGKNIGQGRVTVDDHILMFKQLHVKGGSFKSDALYWLQEQLQKGVSPEGIVCDDPSHALLGCIQGNRLLQASYDPEQLQVYLVVDSSLLTSSKKSNKHFLPLSSATQYSAVADYTLNQSYTTNSQHYLLGLGTTLSKGEHHIRGSVRNVFNESEQSSNQYGELSEFYYRNDQQGTQLTAGLQEQWNFYDNLAGNMLFHPREDVIALSWGSSSHTGSADWVDAVFPVQVFMPEAGRVEVYRDGALLSTEVVAAGLSELKTTYWPQGVYEVDVKTYVAGRLFDTQRQTVFKDSSGQSKKAGSLWLGAGAPNRHRLYGKPIDGKKENYKALLGGSFSYPLTPGLSLSSAVYLSEVSSALELGGRLYLGKNTPVTLSLMHTELQSRGINLRLSTRAGKSSLSSLYEYFHASDWRDAEYYMNDRHRLSGYVSYTLSSGHLISVSLQKDLMTHRFTQTLGYRYSIKLAERDSLESYLSLQHGDRVVERCQTDDVFKSAGLSINWRLTWSFGGASINNNRLALEYNNTANDLTAVTGDYYQQPDIDWLQTVSLSGRMTRNNYQAWSSAGIQAPVVSGTMGGAVQGGESYQGWSVYSNLSGQIGITDQTIAWGSGKTRSGALFEVTEAGVGKLKAEVNGRPYLLSQKISFIPLAPFRSYRLVVKPLDQKELDDLLLLERDYFQCTAYPGNALSYQVDAWYAVDIIAQVVDEQEQPLGHLLLINNRGQFITDSKGIFSMTLDRSQPEITGIKEGKQCTVDISQSLQNCSEQLFCQLGKLTCRLQ